MSQHISAKSNEKAYQLLREKFVRSSGSRLIFSNRTKQQNPQEEMVVINKRDWLKDIYAEPTIYYYF